MTDSPDNLTLRLLQDMRRDNERVVEGMQTVMRVIERMNQRLAALEAEVGALRSETKAGFARIEGDIMHLENQKMSRHGETLSLMRRVGEIERT